MSSWICHSLLALVLVACVPHSVSPQAGRLDRVAVNGQELWLNGANVAWVNFARDIGPGETRLDVFERIFRELHENGGNTMRLWLHTTGAASPEWDGEIVVGPGEGTIEDLTAILDLARKHEIRLMLCLWSFDMLRISNGKEITDRSFALLTNEQRLQSYIDNALVPMVGALRGHPAILAWEIFNEPEGMSEEFGWEFNRHVPMSAIQRFINRTAGAIKRTDPGTLVTNGSWSFRAASDVTADRDLLIAGRSAEGLSVAELERVRSRLAERYGYLYTLEEARELYRTLQEWGDNHNYYADERLIAAGGDPQGVLDFYTVHYYDWGSTQISPFHHEAGFWGLDKPLVVAEFFLNDTFGVAWPDLYEVLHARGYAGALGWQWSNAYENRAEGARQWPRILRSVRRMQEVLAAGSGARFLLRAVRGLSGGSAPRAGRESASPESRLRSRRGGQDPALLPPPDHHPACRPACPLARGPGPDHAPTPAGAGIRARAAGRAARR